VAPSRDASRAADTWPDQVATQVTEQPVDRCADRLGGLAVLPHNSLGVSGRGIPSRRSAAKLSVR